MSADVVGAAPPPWNGGLCLATITSWDGLGRIPGIRSYCTSRNRRVWVKRTLLIFSEDPHRHHRTGFCTPRTTWAGTQVPWRISSAASVPLKPQPAPLTRRSFHQTLCVSQALAVASATETILSGLGLTGLRVQQTNNSVPSAGRENGIQALAQIRVTLLKYAHVNPPMVMGLDA